MPHIIESLGKTRVVVKDGKVIEVGEPQIDWCPLFAKKRGIEKITKDAVRENMEFRIKDFGMFTDNRILEHEVFVGFGASEVMMTGLRGNILDTTVTVCEGAGTVITSNPTLVQGMGARMSGLVETEPIEGIINGIDEIGGVVLEPSTAVIDPVAGVKKAAQLGYKKIAVSAIDPNTAKKLREIEAELDLDLIIIAAHSTGLSRKDALELISYIDIILACASSTIRDVIKPLVQVGAGLPLFAVTQKGKELLLDRAKEIESPILINTTSLPTLPEHKQPRELI